MRAAAGPDENRPAIREEENFRIDQREYEYGGNPRAEISAIDHVGHADDPEQGMRKNMND